MVLGGFCVAEIHMEVFAEKDIQVAWNEVLKANPQQPKESTAFQIIQFSFSQAQKGIKRELKLNTEQYFPLYPSQKISYTCLNWSLPTQIFP